MNTDGQEGKPNSAPLKERHPTGLYTLFFTEMWERFSYYGMRALLMLFMVAAIQEEDGLGFTELTAGAIYGLYTAAVYLVALPGGWIADRLLGAQRSVWYGGIIIALGHFTLAIPSLEGVFTKYGLATPTLESFFVGLVLVVVGTGLLKPNVSAIVGGLYPEGGTRRDAGFTIFYMGINLGAFIGPLICGYLGEKVNWHYGFGAAGVGMVLGLIQYRIMQKHLGDAGLHPHRKKGGVEDGIDRGWYIVAGGAGALVVLVVLGLTRTITFNPEVLADNARYAIVAIGVLYFVAIFRFGKLNATETRRCVVLIVLLIASAIFWSGFEQAGSSLNLFAERHTVRVFGETSGFEIPASWFQSLNPIYIILLAPVFASLWVRLAQHNLDPSLPAKFAFGLILLGVGFLVMAGAAMLVAKSGPVLPHYLAMTYLLFTFGELCLSPVGLSAVTKLAPQRFVGQMMGLWFLATSLGNLIAGLMGGEISSVAVGDMSGLYLRIVLTTAGTGLLLLLFVRPLRKLMGDVR